MSEAAPFSSHVAVIGGGPAGLMAAETIAAAGHRVSVYDHMPTFGRKFLMAGRGGLNLTHEEPPDSLLAHYAEAAAPLTPIILAMPPDAVRAWCQKLGVETFVGTSKRVFPVGLKASPLLRAWLARLDGLGVQFNRRHRWTGWSDQGALCFATPAGPTQTNAAATVLALGGASWPRLGSDGAWPGLLPDIAIAPLRPANCGFEVAWSSQFRARFEGQPLKRVALHFRGITLPGEAVITADGIEGGVIYALSAALRDTIAAEGSATVMIDLRPDLAAPVLAARLSADRGSQSLSTYLRKTIGLSPLAIGLVQEALHSDTGSSAGDLPRLVKALPLHLLAPRPIARAISTAGGIAWAALDARLMLRDRPGVFTAGEMLDWEAPTGGYLLQACFSTGAAAGRGAVAWLAEQNP